MKIIVVLPAGVEPALDYSKQILSLQRLPIPPWEHLGAKSCLYVAMDLGFVTYKGVGKWGVLYGLVAPWTWRLDCFGFASQ